MNVPAPHSDGSRPPVRPLVSVIVTTYNRREMLLKTLDAVLSQTYRDLELIVVDNDSGDGTEAGVAGLDDGRIRYFRNANGGVIAVNRNFGIERAVGNFIAFCDDDDIWFPDKLERQMELFSSKPEIGVVASNAYLFDGRRRIGLVLARVPRGPIGRSHLLFRGNPILLSSAVVRKDLLDEYGGFCRAPELVAAEDYDLWLSNALLGRAAVILDAPLLLYRVHPGQTSSRDRRASIRRILRSLARQYALGRLGGGLYCVSKVHNGFRLLIAEAKEIARRIPGLESRIRKARRIRRISGD